MYQRGRETPQHRVQLNRKQSQGRSWGSMQPMPGLCTSLYSVIGWQPETRKERRGEERDTGSPSEENLSDRQEREGLRGAAGQMDRRGTLLFLPRVSGLWEDLFAVLGTEHRAWCRCPPLRYAPGSFYVLILGQALMEFG